MFSRLGEFVSRRSLPILLFYFVLLFVAIGIQNGGFKSVFPNLKGWSEIVEDGEFAFLPTEMPSIRAESLYRKAFPQRLLASTVVVVVRRESRPLDDRDEAFIEDILVRELADLKEDEGSLIERIRTSRDKAIGRLLVSQDRKASLVIVDLKTEFLEHQNAPTIKRVEELLVKLKSQIPTGIDLALSGSATVGRDMLQAAKTSARNTEKYTLILVVGLLLMIYRAPFLAIIPLFSVFVAVEISLAIIVLLTQIPSLHFRPFEGLKTYITVVTYGAGVDYCLFLIARYKEELDRRSDVREALPLTISKVGSALLASAATVAFGIFMMYFALFGKFQQAGKGMALSLVIMLIASLTFTPALLRLSGKWAFWPHLRSASPREAGWISGTNLLSRWLQRNQLHQLWESVAAAVIRSPIRIWTICVLLMLPFAIWGLVHQGHLSYGLLSELPVNNSSVVGARAVQDHFPAGEAGPVTLLLEKKDYDFQSREGINFIRELTDKLSTERESLGLADVRSVSHPVGIRIIRTAQESILARGIELRYYISVATKGEVTRVDLISDLDPFSRDSIQQLEKIKTRIQELLPEEFADLKLHVLGTTASMSDLKRVTDRDQVVVDVLVLLIVFLILVALLKRPAISAYLIVSVFFSYFVALGVTFAVFQVLNPTDFAGLDWKVPMFLFTILIAVGEDYNIFLMTRIDEEQQTHGPLEGVRRAVVQTGSIISSCGIIMAGTFFSLVLAGSLAGMQQLGFALTFGVLLDTFVVRPILVPAWLAMLYSGKLGLLGNFLGAREVSPKVKPPEA